MKIYAIWSSDAYENEPRCYVEAKDIDDLKNIMNDRFNKGEPFGMFPGWCPVEISKISYDDTKVEAWTIKNIPFESKGWQKIMKVRICEALKKLPPSDKKELYASYTTIDDKRCDVENILLYNIGSGAFNKICGSSLCIERGYDDALTTQMPHHYKYELVDKANFVIHKPLKTLVKWQGKKLEENDIKVSYLKPSFFWNYIKESRNNVEVFKENYNVGDKYGIEVFIKTPSKKINLASFIKPLLDGIICAFHKQKNDEDFRTSEKLILEKLSNKIVPNDKIIDYLFDNKYNILGERNLVTKGGNLNPADDLCDAIKLTVSTDKKEWKIDGKIFSVT